MFPVLYIDYFVSDMHVEWISDPAPDLSATIDDIVAESIKRTHPTHRYTVYDR